MKAQIKFNTRTEEFFIEENCYIRELSNSEGDPELSIAQARVPVGVTTRWHSLDGIAERYCILQGEGIVEIGEQPPQRLQSGDVAIIPPSCRQRIYNCGKQDLIFLALCTPRFTPSAYQHLE
jgi:mannose-6-phosphate isomerase-like protein (cupin superfamily)